MYYDKDEQLEQIHVVHKQFIILPFPESLLALVLNSTILRRQTENDLPHLHGKEQKQITT